MNMKKILCGAAAGVLLLGACQKGDGGGPGGINPMVSLFRQHVAAATQHFTVNAAAGGMITGNDGSTVQFSPNAFRHPDGSMVTGVVQVQLVEALTIADMVWLNKQTMGDDGSLVRPLVSGGEIKLTASQGGQTVNLAAGGSFIIIPTPQIDMNMELFLGEESEEGLMRWDPAPATMPLIMDSTQFQSYAFGSDTMGWINCDYFMGQGLPMTQVNITPPSGYDDQNTAVWIVFPAENSVASVHYYDVDHFTTDYAQLPIGYNVIVVAYAVQNGQAFSSFTPTTITNGMNLLIPMQATTEAQFQTDLGNL